MLPTNRAIIPTTKQLLYINETVVKPSQKRLECVENGKVPLVTLLIRIPQRLHRVEYAQIHIPSRNDTLQHALTRQIPAPVVRQVLPFRILSITHHAARREVAHRIVALVLVHVVLLDVLLHVLHQHALHVLGREFHAALHVSSPPLPHLAVESDSLAPRQNADERKLLLAALASNPNRIHRSKQNLIVLSLRLTPLSRTHILHWHERRRQLQLAPSLALYISSAHFHAQTVAQVPAWNVVQGCHQTSQRRQQLVANVPVHVRLQSSARRLDFRHGEGAVAQGVGAKRMRRVRADADDVANEVAGVESRN